MINNLLLSLKETYMSFGKKEIFKDINLNIHKGDLIALVGKNGVGKSTLMRIIYNQLDIDQGEIWKTNNLKISYFSQIFDINENNTIEKELSIILNNKEEDYKIDIYCNNLLLNRSDIISNLSGGQKRRVALIKSLIIDSDILLLDEPTNHLDLKCILWLENYLIKYKGSIICVSHDRNFLSNFTNKIFWIDRKNIRTSPTGFKNFENWTANLFDQEKRQLKNRKQFVDIEVEWANKGIKARVKRNLQRLERAKKLKLELERDESSYRKSVNSIKLKPLLPSPDKSKSIAEFYKVSVKYKGFDDKIILNNLSIKINKNDRIGLLGNNGTGKSTFLKTLIGEIPVVKGTVKIKKNMNFSYFDQMRNDLKKNETLKNILVPNGGDYLNVQGKIRHVCSYLKDFMFDPSKAIDSIETLSGGEKNRLLLAKVLANPQTGLILDEPTNDLDLETMDLLTQMLSNYKGTLLIVSHDRDFLDRTVNKILYFQNDGKISLFMGGYSDFLNFQKNEEKNVKATLSINEKKLFKKKISKSNKLSFKFKYELENIPKEIEILQNKIDLINSELTNVNLYNDNFDRFDKITTEVSVLKYKLQEKEDRWLELLHLEEDSY